MYRLYTTRTKVKICQSIRCTMCTVYSVHLYQIRAIYKFCGISRKGTHLSLRVPVRKCSEQSVVTSQQCTTVRSTLFCIGVIFFIFLYQECHIKIKAKCHNFLVKVSQMTRVPQVENDCCKVFPVLGRYSSTCTRVLYSSTFYEYS